MPLDVDGLDQLMTDIAAMTAQLDMEKGSGRIANSILEKAAVPVEEQMKANASRDPKIITNKLHGAIHTGTVKKRRNGGKHITIGVHRKDWDGEEYYPAYVEYVRPDRVLMKVD